MQTLLETPWPAIWIGVLLEVLLVVVLLNTRSGRVVAAMGIVSLVVLVMLLVEWLVVTDREAVQNTLAEIETALEANDAGRVLSHLAPESTGMRDAVERYMGRIEITEANVGGDLKITLNRATPRPSARTEFTGRISFEPRNPGELAPYRNYVRKFTVYLEQRDDRWVVTNYDSAEAGP
jgi:hypothetical protein